MVSPAKEQQLLEDYACQIQQVKDARDTLYHIDIPFSVETQVWLLTQAGFSKVDVIWHKEDEESAIFAATKSR